MLRPKVYVTRKIPESGLAMIEERFEVEIWPEHTPPPKTVILEKVRHVDALVSLLSDKIDAEIYDSAPRLKIIAQYAVGFDNIDVKDATKRGIYITNTPEVLTETTADFAWALLMAVARRVVEADKYVRTGRWKVGWQPNMLLGKEVHGATIGIIGAGRIGSAVARRAKGFQMKIVYYDIIPRTELEEELDAERVDLETLLKKSDFVSVHVPLTKQTFHMINEEKISLMKKTAYLINNSRGSVVDENSLCHAIKEKMIAGAGLDVFEQEPTPLDNILLSLDNVVVAPHVSSGTYKTRSRMAEMVAENLIAFFEGRTPPNLVNQEILKKLE